MGRAIAVALIFVVSLAVPASAVARQRRPPPPTPVGGGRFATQAELDDRNKALNELHAAAERYLAGDTAGALDALDRMSASKQMAYGQVVTGLLRHEREIQKGKKVVVPPGMPTATIPLLPWDTRLVRALGALEMEAFLRAYTERDTKDGQAVGYLRAGEALFGYVAEEPGETYAGSRWELAVGLTAFAEGELRWASEALRTACAEPEEDRDILLACGSLTEAYGMLPSDLLLQTIHVVNPPRRRSQVQGTQMTRETNPYGLSESSSYRADTFTGAPPSDIRRHYLERAAEPLEEILRADPLNAQARLRLAHVRIELGKEARATPLLEDITSGKVEADPAVRYLARLFLAGIHRRAGHLDPAGRLLEDAIAVVPSGQSAFVALAEIERARGDATSTAAVIARMLQAPAEPRDPWWDYGFGQYWAVEPLLAALRKEARR